MSPAELQRLFAYNAWANARILTSCDALSPERFTRDLGGSYRSVRGTVIHIFEAEWVWLQRCRGASRGVPTPPGPFPSLASLRRAWGALGQQYLDLIAAAGPGGLSRLILYSGAQGQHWANPLQDVLLHVINHSSHHRGQTITLLRLLQAEPVPTDFLYFLAEIGSPQPLTEEPID